MKPQKSKPKPTRKRVCVACETPIQSTWYSQTDYVHMPGKEGVHVARKRYWHPECWSRPAA